MKNQLIVNTSLISITLAGSIEMKMYDMRLKQKDVARKLNVSDAKL